MRVVAQHEAIGWLVQNGAQHDVVEWATRHAPTWSQLWLECPRGDWLLAIAARSGAPTAQVFHAALACLPVLEPYLPERQPVIERALRWVRGATPAIDDATMLIRELEATLTESVDPAAHAAVLALHALLCARTDPSAAASMVAATVQAAAMDAVDCGMIEAARYTEHACASAVRGAITLDGLLAALNAH